jgi:hypothetical protein
MLWPALAISNAWRQVMRKWLPAVAMAGLLSVPGQSEAGDQRPTLPEESAPCRVGRLIAAQLHPGMPAKEANRVLGNLMVEEGQFFENRATMVFRRYGFRVTEARDESGQWRISRVGFLPLFGD